MGPVSFDGRASRRRGLAFKGGALERVAVLLPSSTSDIRVARSDYADEFAACSSVPQFFPVMYNEDEFAAGGSLAVSEIAPVKTMYCIRRGGAFTDERAIALCHALKRFGYRDALRYSHGNYAHRLPDVPVEEWGFWRHMPEAMHLHYRHGRRASEGRGWEPDLKVLNGFMPAVAKGGGGVLKDANGMAKVFQELPSWDYVEQIVRQVSGEPPDRPAGTPCWTPMRFEKWVDIAYFEGVPVEWRLFCYGGYVILLAPKTAAAPELLPPPPQKLIDVAMSYRDFEAVDYALDTTGKWWVLEATHGERATLPAGGSPRAFYEGLVQAIEFGATLPEWCWCAVADVVDTHPIGEKKVVVEGSRHFAPGTKVYFADAYWGSGGERCTVIGVPKYSDYPIGVTMRTDYLANFRLEKVTDPAVIKALCTNRLREPFEYERGTCLCGRWSTADTDTGKSEIEQYVDWRNGRRPSI